MCEADQDSAPEAAKIEPIVEGSQDAATKEEGDIMRPVETIDTDVEVPPAPDTLSQQETVITHGLRRFGFFCIFKISPKKSHRIF